MDEEAALAGRIDLKPLNDSTDSKKASPEALAGFDTPRVFWNPRPAGGAESP
jgi:hypothetical protein